MRVAGLEPAWIYPLDFKSSAYTISATLALIGSRSLIRTDDHLITNEVLYQLSYTGRMSD